MTPELFRCNGIYLSFLDHQQNGNLILYPNQQYHKIIVLKKRGFYGVHSPKATNKLLHRRQVKTFSPYPSTIQ